ncbi:MAG: VCBS repeat-containing protein [Planctomycetota bacterium]|nr:VCBS repeat-containing protein [Planctomycetota bacterium]
MRLTVLPVTFAMFGFSDAEPWVRHTIDNSSRGADGVRLADLNGDGHQDITTGWEEGNLIRVYINPGPDKTKGKWQTVTVGKVASPEDAVFADLDGDGALDVVSSCEGKTKTVFVHWAPSEAASYLDEKAWKTEAIPATEKKSWWMFAVPMQVDGKRGTDLVIASKGKSGAMVGWLESPENPRDLAAWKYHHMQDAGWVMSLRKLDVDGDGYDDMIVSDRFGNGSGTYWLKHPGHEQVLTAANWARHDIAGNGKEVMFIGLRQSKEGMIDVVTPLRTGSLLWSRGSREGGKTTWQTSEFRSDALAGSGKAAAIGDIDLDGKLDVVYTIHTGRDRQKRGTTWLSYKDAITDKIWMLHDISGEEGVKFDRVELLDLDADGDLDVLTCEEVDQLGVFWYENPTR